MTVSPLLHDALRSAPNGSQIRLGLPWIRSLPLAAVSEINAVIDGFDAVPLSIVLGERRVSPEALLDETGWWYLQDRLVLETPVRLAPGKYSVEVALTLLVPYLSGGPNLPLTLRLSALEDLALDNEDAAPAAAREVA